jgi:hypothetical protein
MQSLIIGLGHKARQGKDQAAKFITEAFSDRYRIKTYSFADALKRELCGKEYDLCLRYGVTYDYDPDMSDPLCYSIHGKQSRLLQFYGDLKRRQDAFYWIHKTCEDIVRDSPQIAIIPSVRYVNEAYWIKSTGGYVIDVVRPGYIDPSRDPNWVSETQLDGFAFDAVLTARSGEHQSLRRQALGVFTDIMGEVEQQFSTHDFTEEGLLCG